MTAVLIYIIPLRSWQRIHWNLARWNAELADLVIVVAPGREPSYHQNKSRRIWFFPRLWKIVLNSCAFFRFEDIANTWFSTRFSSSDHIESTSPKNIIARRDEPVKVANR